jgi:hypothetical protein
MMTRPLLAFERPLPSLLAPPPVAPFPPAPSICPPWAAATRAGARPFAVPSSNTSPPPRSPLSAGQRCRRSGTLRPRHHPITSYAAYKTPQAAPPRSSGAAPPPNPPVTLLPIFVGEKRICRQQAWQASSALTPAEPGPLAPQDILAGGHDCRPSRCRWGCAGGCAGKAWVIKPIEGPGSAPPEQRLPRGGACGAGAGRRARWAGRGWGSSAPPLPLRRRCCRVRTYRCLCVTTTHAHSLDRLDVAAPAVDINDKPLKITTM